MKQPLSIHTLFKMSRFQLFFVLYSFFVFYPTFSESKENEASPTGINTSAENFRIIFENNLKESQKQAQKNREQKKVELSFINQTPVHSQFSTSYYRLNLDHQMSSLKAFGIQSRTPLASDELLSYSLQYGFHFTSEEEILRVQSVKTKSIYRDLIRYQSAPFNIGLQANVALPSALRNFGISRLYAQGDFIYEWISLTGSLDGINQSTWSPGWEASLGIHLFQSNDSQVYEWFDGIAFGTSFRRALFDKRPVTSFDGLELKFLIRI